MTIRSQRCAAHTQRGSLCQRWSVLGGRVCQVHGGAAPQVKAAAERRLLAMVEPALVVLRQLLDSADNDSVRMAAIRDILDRTGFKPREVVEAQSDVTINVVRYEEPTGYLAPARHNGHTLPLP
jgi:hypothetical protein